MRIERKLAIQRALIGGMAVVMALVVVNCVLLVFARDIGGDLPFDPVIAIFAVLFPVDVTLCVVILRLGNSIERDLQVRYEQLREQRAALEIEAAMREQINDIFKGGTT